MSVERIVPGKRRQQCFSHAIQNFFVLTAIVLIFIITNSAESAGSILLSYQLPNGEVGVPYAGTISASGGISPYTFSMVDGTLPAGLTLNRTSGSITGTPTIAATKYLRVRVTDARGAVVSIQARLAIFASSNSDISIAISPTATRMASGKSQQFSATVQGTSNTAVTWSAIAGSVSNTGVVTAPVVTSDTRVTVIATSAADSTKKAIANVLVSPTAPTLSVTTSSLNPAQPGTVYSSSLSASGGAAPYRWSLAAGALPIGFTLSGSGQLSGTTSQTGTFAITAAATDATNVIVAKPLLLSVSASSTTSSAGSDGPSQLPTTYFNTAMANTPAPGTTILVPAGGSLQTALNKATCGDTIKLAAGATFKGLFTLPAKPCDNSHWIIIRTSAPNSALPAEGSRMLPCYAGVSSLPGRPSFKCPSLQNVLAKIVFQSVGIGPFQLANGANHYRLVGLEITRVAGNGFVGALLGAANGTLAHHVILDRVWLHGTAQDETKGGLHLSGTTYVAAVDSYFSDFHCIAMKGSCTDAQAINGGGGNAPGGPYKIVNNFLEASGENIMFGGADATTTPADIEIRRNHLFKPMAWKPGRPDFVGSAANDPFIVKNLFELKNAQRVLFEGNVLENVWGGFSQTGFSILLTPVNQENACPLCRVTDVTIRYNKVIHCASVLQMVNAFNKFGTSASAGERYSIHDLLVDDLDGEAYKGFGNFLTIVAPKLPIKDVLIDHVTAFPTRAVITLINGVDHKLDNFTITNNVFSAGVRQIASAGGGSGNCASVPGNRLADIWNSCFSNSSFTHNLIIDAKGVWPGDNVFMEARTAGIPDLRKVSVSQYRPCAKKGDAACKKLSRVGADIDAIERATAGVN